MPGTVSTCVVIPDGSEIQVGCKQCRRIIVSTKGKYLVGVIVNEGGQSLAYTLGVDPPVFCCGEKKGVIKTFDTEDEAEAERLRVFAHLASKSPKGLPLVLVANETVQ